MKVNCFTAKLSDEPDDHEYYISIVLDDTFTFTLNEIFESHEAATPVSEVIKALFLDAKFEVDNTPKETGWNKGE